MDLQSLKQNSWWGYLDESHRDLLLQSIELLKREEEEQNTSLFHDYAFVVFPAAKAYEGFLKKLFLGLGLINEFQYAGRQFRIGKSLNPSIEDRLKDQDWVFDSLKDECSETLPQFLWETWRQSRNLVFHWFPDHKNFITLQQSRGKIEMIVEAMERCFSECKITNDK